MCQSYSTFRVLLLFRQQKKSTWLRYKKPNIQAPGTTFSKFSDEVRPEGEHEKCRRFGTLTERECAKELISGLPNFGSMEVFGAKAEKRNVLGKNGGRRASIGFEAFYHRGTLFFLRLLTLGAPYPTRKLTSEFSQNKIAFRLIIPWPKNMKKNIFRSKIGILTIMGEGSPSFRKTKYGNALPLS